MRRTVVNLPIALCAIPAFSSQPGRDQIATTPDLAPQYAETGNGIAEAVLGKRLDYSPQSLKDIDSLVLRFRANGSTPQKIRPTLIFLGCYVGEVLVRNLKLAWDMPNAKELQLGFSFVGVRSAGGGFSDPIGKTFKLLQNGEEDSVFGLYVALESR